MKATRMCTYLCMTSVSTELQVPTSEIDKGQQLSFLPLGSWEVNHWEGLSVWVKLQNSLLVRDKSKPEKTVNASIVLLKTIENERAHDFSYPTQLCYLSLDL